jgi:hypothetical protein
MKAVRLVRALALSGGLAAIVLGTAVGPATAKPLEREHFHDSFSVVEEEFCGDLTVRHDLEVDGVFLFNFHGPDGLGYGLEKVRGTESFTNVDNDLSYTNVFNNVSKDLKVTDNGDGTLTLLVMSAGMSKWFGPDGEFLFLDSGHFRFEVLIDHGGTPTDPSDDEEIEGSFRVVRDLTGRTDTEGRDFCDDIHEFIG